MAEGIARQLQRDGKLPTDLFFASAGTAAADGWPIADEASAVLKRLGAEADGHSKPLTAAMVRKAALVLGMTKSHVGSARSLVSADNDQSVQAAKIHTLDPSGDIADPIGQDQEVYDAVGRRMLQLIPQRLQEMLKS
jgi:protein-tyrosine-phosphatase